MKSETRIFRRFFIEQLERRHLLASDFLLEIDGIKGESSDAKHPGAIELESFSWGASNSARSGLADPLTTEDFRFVTSMSNASPQLYAATGKHIAKATLFVRKQGTDQHEYLKIKLTDILISSIRSRSLNEELPKEEVSLSFKSIHQELYPTNSDGTIVEPITTSWTIDPTKQRSPSSSSLLKFEPSSNLDQTDVFLKIDGIKGEATQAKYKDQIQIESWSFGASNASTSAGSGGGAGKAVFQDLHFVTRVSKASPNLLRAAATGKHIPTANFELRRADAPNNEFLKVKFTDLLVSSYQVVGSTETETLEEVTLSFKSMTQSYSGGRSTIETSLEAADNDGAQTSSEKLIENTIPTVQASDVFIKFDGIEGESTAAKHKGSLQIDAFSWGVSNAGATSVGGGAGKVNVQDLSFTSSANKATPKLILHAAQGKHIPSAILSVRKQGGNQEDYLTIKLENTLVSSYNVSSHGGDQGTQPRESLSLNFAKVSYSYSPEDASRPRTSPVEFSWTIPTSAVSVATSVSPPVVTIPRTAEAVDYFLKIGDIKGESTRTGHKGEIEVLSWSWGVSQQVSNSSGGGAGKASFQDFHFVARSSSTSPQILDKFAFQAASGTHIPKMVLSARKTGATADYLKIELSNALISSIQTQSLDRSAPLEEVSFNYSKIEWDYRSSSKSSPVVSGPIAVRQRDDRSPGTRILDETQVRTGIHDIFLEIEGIKGESQNVKHKIDISSFSFGASQTGSFSGGSGAGKVSLQDFHFVKTADPVSADLLRALADGKHFADVQLVVRRSNSEPYLTYKLSDVLISSFTTQGSDGTQPMEDFSLNFTKLETSHIKYFGIGGTNTIKASLDTKGFPFEHDPGKHLLDQTSPSRVSADYFLKLDGIKGESADKDHKDWIVIDSFSWGADRAIVRDDTGNKLPGEFAFRDFSFVGNYDKSSPKILESLVGGKVFSNVVLDIDYKKNSGQRDLSYLFNKDCSFTSHSLSGNNPGIPTAHWTLTPASVDASFLSTPQISASEIEVAPYSFFSFDRDDEEERPVDGPIVDMTSVDLHFSLISEI